MDAASHASSSSSMDSDDAMDREERSQIQRATVASNRKRHASGGFQAMGLSYPIFNAIVKKGFKVPTPIQRKSIPLILQGRDVVAMARTGSGKTAAFVIPMLEKLKSHSAKVGCRAVILSPSRELALQTMKVVKELGRYTDLRCAMIVGGDRIEEQFTQMATNPDILIATPGRLLHILMEMNMDLKMVEYLVFDEADRLFEMGFADTMNEILTKVNSNRMTHLFSATLPKTLVDFAKAGLSEPVLVRLDTDNKVSPDLELGFFMVKPSEKEAALLFLLRSVIKPDDLSIIFACTRHHVEYLHELLLQAGIENAYIYGSLDQSARRLNLAKFRDGHVKVLVVTDVAARGIDIPLLNNVIHYDFPDRSKLFIHRSGRAARAGRMGTSYAMVTPDELPYMLDLQLFLARPFTYAGDLKEEPDFKQQFILGNLPSSVIEDDIERVQELWRVHANLDALRNVSKNGFKLFTKTRHTTAKESYHRSREILDEAPAGSSKLGIHPLFVPFVPQGEQDRVSFIDKLRNFRPPETIFEFKKMGVSKTAEADLVMKARRSQAGIAIEKRRMAKAAKEEKHRQEVDDRQQAGEQQEDAGESDIENAFSRVVGKKRSKPSEFRDEEYYVSHYQQGNDGTDAAYAVNEGVSGFLRQAGAASMDLTGDDRSDLAKKQRNATGTMRWDSKKRRYIRETVGADNKKMIRTESGALLPASYKTNVYDQWRKRTKLDVPRAGERESESVSKTAASLSGRGGRPYRHTKVTVAKQLDPLSLNYERKLKQIKKREMLAKEGRGGAADPTQLLKQQRARGIKTELKSAERVQKDRKIQEKRRQKNARPTRKHKQRK